MPNYKVSNDVDQVLRSSTIDDIREVLEVSHKNIVESIDSEVEVLKTDVELLSSYDYSVDSKINALSSNLYDNASKTSTLSSKTTNISTTLSSLSLVVANLTSTTNDIVQYLETYIPQAPPSNEYTVTYDRTVSQNLSFVPSADETYYAETSTNPLSIVDLSFPPYQGTSVGMVKTFICNVDILLFTTTTPTSAGKYTQLLNPYTGFVPSYEAKSYQCIQKDEYYATWLRLS